VDLIEYTTAVLQGSLLRATTLLEKQRARIEVMEASQRSEAYRAQREMIFTVAGSLKYAMKKVSE
jgi:hypothetical protein